MEKKIRITVPYRKLTSYQMDCGFRLEHYELAGTAKIVIDAEIPEDHEILNNDEIMLKEIIDEEDLPSDLRANFSTERKDIFIGVSQAPSELGPQEFNFEITDVKTLEEAFGKWLELSRKGAEQVAEKVHDAINKRMAERDQEIKTATPEMLQEIDRLSKEQKTPGNIKLP